MIIEVKIPPLPESVTEGTLATWQKKVGDFVARDENLIDLETDKVALELPAPQAGVLTEILFESGAVVTSGLVIARIDTAATQEVSTDSGTQAAHSLKNNSEDTKTSMPSAAKIAAEKGIDLERVTGSGRGGRILKEDVEEAAHAVSQKSVNPPNAAKPSAAQTVVSGTTGNRHERREPMSRLRQSVAARLILSQQTNAILTTFNEVNMKPVLDLRVKYKERFEKEHGVKLGIMSFFVKAVVHALKKYPVVNAQIDGTDIVYHDYYDIGVAVGSARGLVVPVLRNADQLSIAEIEKQIADFGKRAQEGRLSLEEMKGGTYTITNGGTFGSMMSTPIINPPQSAILGMHATKERAVVEDGQIVVRPMMYLAQSYDHRLLDGREAVLSLGAMKDALEDPARLLLEL